jgi:hypothetical protein
MKKTFYRVSNVDTQQGLWYDYEGNFTGLIHDKFNFCQNKDLRMDFDQTLVGWLSATDALETLYKWFTVEDILKLQENGYAIYVFEAEEYWFYEPFQHWVINQHSSKIVDKITLKHLDI